MTDDELVIVVALTAILVLYIYIGYLVNKWKIRDLEDRIERLEKKDEHIQWNIGYIPRVSRMR